MDADREDNFHEIEKQFRSYVSPERVNYVQSDAFKIFAMRSATINFGMLLLREQSVEHLRKLVEQATILASKHRGFIEVIAGPLMVVTFGAIDQSANADEHARNRLEFVKTSSRDMEAYASILHGLDAALVGDYGGPRRSTFGTLFPRYTDLLRKLLEMTPGSVSQWANTPPGTSMV